MIASTVDTAVRRKAVDKLSSGPSFKKSEPKPGEALAPDSGYPQKFIQDWNDFQNSYKEQRETNPDYWERAQKWWGEVRKHVDQNMQDRGEKLQGSAVDRLRGPKPDFQREAK